MSDAEGVHGCVDFLQASKGAAAIEERRRSEMDEQVGADRRDGGHNRDRRPNIRRPCRQPGRQSSQQIRR